MGSHTVCGNSRIQSGTDTMRRIARRDFILQLRTVRNQCTLAQRRRDHISQRDSGDGLRGTLRTSMASKSALAGVTSNLRNSAIASMLHTGSWRHKAKYIRCICHRGISSHFMANVQSLEKTALALPGISVKINIKQSKKHRTVKEIFEKDKRKRQPIWLSGWQRSSNTLALF